MTAKQCVLILLTLLTFSSFATAQTPPPAPTPLGAPPIVATPIAPPVANPTDVPALKFYGFIMPQLIVATHAMASFSQTNLSAITEAAQGSERGRASFQTQQSRLGFNYKAAPDVRAKVEVDFIDFAKSTPTVQAYPRLRLLKVEYDLDPKTTIFMGQDWDLFSPLTSYTYNLVGGHFRSGNAAFIRHQLGVISQQIANFELAASIGFPVANASPSDQAPELEQQPVYQARVGTKFGNSKLSVSGIYARYAFEPIAATAQLSALEGSSSGADVSFETTWDRFEVRAETFFGHNLANLGTLTLGLARRSLNDVDELGGFLSIRYKFERSSVFGGFGIDQILNQDSIVEKAQSVNGIRSNQQIRLGYDWELSPKFKAYVEGVYLATKYYNSNEGGYAQINGFQLAF